VPVTKRTTKVGTDYWEVAVKKTRRGRTVRKTKNLPCAEFTKKDAQRLMARMQVEIEDNFDARLDGRKGKKATLLDLINDYQSTFEPTGNWSKTKKGDIRRMKAYDIARIQASNLTVAAWTEHATTRRKTCQPATVNQDFIWFKQVIQTADDMGYDVDVQALNKAISLLKKNRVIAPGQARDVRPTVDELDRLLCHFDRRYAQAEIPMSELCLFALFSARRQSEICRVEWKDYNSQDKTLLVRDAKNPKGSKGNHILTSVPPRAAAIIERQPRTPTEPRIFPYVANSVANSFYHATNKLDLEHLTFHTLRHEAASHYGEIGYDIPRLALITGHKTWKHLERYAHLSDIKRRDKYQGWERVKDLPAPKISTGRVVELRPGAIGGR